MHRANPSCSSCHRVIDPHRTLAREFRRDGRVAHQRRRCDGRRLGRALRRKPSRRTSRSQGRPLEALGGLHSQLHGKLHDLRARAPGRVLRHARRPSDRARGGGERPPHVFLHPRHREEHALPHGQRGGGARRDDRRSLTKGEKRRMPMYSTNKHLSRRAVLRGMGATVALPFLEAMVPARRAWADASPGDTRLVCIEMVHGAAGSNAIGLEKNLWSPAAVGRDFDLTSSSLSPLEPFREYITIVSNTDCRNAEAFSAPEVGGDHFRSSAVFLTQEHPKQTEGSDVHVGKSLDQLYAERFGQDTPIPSMQLCIENVDQSGGCSYGYACVYTDTISWASPTAAASHDP